MKMTEGIGFFFKRMVGELLHGVCIQGNKATHEFHMRHRCPKPAAHGHQQDPSVHAIRLGS